MSGIGESRTSNGAESIRTLNQIGYWTTAIVRVNEMRCEPACNLVFTSQSVQEDHPFVRLPEDGDEVC